MSKKAYIHDIGIERRKSSASEENEAIYFVFGKSRIAKLIRCYSTLTAIQNAIPGIEIAIAK